MWNILLFPFRLIGTVLSLVFEFIGSLFGFVFGLVGGIFGFVLNGLFLLLVIVGIIALVQWIMQRHRGV